MAEAAAPDEKPGSENKAEKMRTHAIYWETDGKSISKMGIKADVEGAPDLAAYNPKESKSIIEGFKKAVAGEAPKTGGLKKSIKRKGGNKRNTRKRRRF
jgi:hypothetical protein